MAQLLLACSLTLPLFTLLLSLVLIFKPLCSAAVNITITAREIFDTENEPSTKGIFTVFSLCGKNWNPHPKYTGTSITQPRRELQNIADFHHTSNVIGNTAFQLNYILTDLD